MDSRSTGNPHIKEKMDLDVQVSKLRLLKANFVSQQYQLESQVMRTYPARIAECKERIANMTADLNAARPFLQADKDQFLMQVGKNTYTERKEAGTALIKLCGSAKDARHEIQAGEYHGFRLGINYNLFSNAYELSIHGQGTYTVELGSDPSGNLTRINNALSSLENRIKENQTQLLTTQEQLAIARQELQKPFAQEQELADKQARLSELNSMLNMDQKDTDAALLEESASPEEEAPAQEQTESVDETTEEPAKLKSVVIEL